MHRRRDSLAAVSAKLDENLTGSLRRGAVIIPAFNEAAVIGRTLKPLSRAAVGGFIELIVVCNGCTDSTADLARSVPGVRVLELEQGSKPEALNAGDAFAQWWPRLYLDADVQISAGSVLAVLDRLAVGDVLVAAPESVFDWRDANIFVRSYFKVRQRIHGKKSVMWRAGAYGVSELGHARLGNFPAIVADDVYVDTRFDASEKALVTDAISLRKTPEDVKNLFFVMRRHHRGVAELLAREHGLNFRVRNSSKKTVSEVFATVRGPVSAFDAMVYLCMSSAARLWGGKHASWERDQSTRTMSGEECKTIPDIS